MDFKIGNGLDSMDGYSVGEATPFDVVLTFQVDSWGEVVRG